jgi:nucleotide-binding universal stress UspA family protein
MNTSYEILICIHGDYNDHPALEFGLNLARLTRWPVTLLGVYSRQLPAGLCQTLDESTDQISTAGVSCQVVTERGSFVKTVLKQVGDRDDQLVLFSDIHQPGLPRWTLFGRFRSIFAGTCAPLIRIRSACWPLRRLLICSGGLAYTIPLEKLAVSLAQITGARLTFLHIVEPVTLDYALAREVAEHWETLQKTDTPQARHLSKALTYAQVAGVDAMVRVRHGAVVKNIMDELAEGDYDLIGLGSAYSSRSLRRHYSADVTALLAAEVDCPLLTMRGSGQDSYE